MSNTNTTPKTIAKICHDAAAAFLKSKKQKNVKTYDELTKAEKDGYEKTIDAMLLNTDIGADSLYNSIAQNYDGENAVLFDAIDENLQIVFSLQFAICKTLK